MNDTPNFGAALSQVIRTRRERLGLTRKQLAGKIGGSESHIKAVEVGKRNPTITVFVLFAGALDISPHDLLHEVSQKQAFLNEKDI